MIEIRFYNDRPPLVIYTKPPEPKKE